jgi:hypothetical protein
LPVLLPDSSAFASVFLSLHIRLAQCGWPGELDPEPKHPRRELHGLVIAISKKGVGGSREVLSAVTQGVESESRDSAELLLGFWRTEVGKPEITQLRR